MAHIPLDKGILGKWLKAGYMDKAVLHPTDEGTPQGGIISPVLANMALDGLEQALRDHFPSATQYHAAKVNLVRYADDFIITGVSEDLLRNEIKPLVEAFLRERGLDLSHEKTVITHIEDGFGFLGQNVRKYKVGDTDRKALLIKPAAKNVKAFLEKARKTVKENKGLPAGKLIALLNPQIRGWAMYHRHVVSKQTFADVDHALYELLWRWAIRRHPNKGKRWVKRKYFPDRDTRHWDFSGEISDGRGVSRAVWIYVAASVPIARHVKIRGEANPYDPAQEPYFEARLGVKMSKTLRGRRALLHLWKEQKGLCPLCAQKITTLTGWHSHHITWRSKGGSDAAGNRVLLHPTCHNKVHSQGIAVEKPHPVKRALHEA